MPSEADRPRRVTVDRAGPILIEGPVDVVTEDGTVSSSDRFVVALCTCRRSRIHPWCDTSHRARKRPPTAGRPADDEHDPCREPKDSHDSDLD